MSAKLDQVLTLLETRKPHGERKSRRVVNDLPSDLPAPAAVPSKLELCRQWFAEHPEDVHRTGRDLAQRVTPQGVSVSYVTWNTAKREMSENVR